MKEYIKIQIEWIKSFFSDDKQLGSPSHKNLIGVAITIIFLIAYMKKSAFSTELVDIPSGWQLTLLSILGIRSAQQAVERIAEKKYQKKEEENNGK